MRLFRRRKKQVNPPAESSKEIPKGLLWLLDAPLFIDEVQVEAFYDAALRPELDATAVRLSEAVSNKFGGDVSFGTFVPGLSIKATGSTSRTRGKNAEYAVVSNPYRHLLSVALHYVSNLPSRMKTVTYEASAGRYQVIEAGNEAWRSSDFISALPRALLFMDLPPGTKFIPAAAEVADKGVIEIYKSVKAEFDKTATTPAPAVPGSGPAHAADRASYWKWFSDNFDASVAMECVERAACGGALKWIAYRVALPGPEEPFLHLWMAVRGGFDTGTVAYNFVKRGYKHGLRIVGTLKSEPDLNVLAVFEK